MEELKDLVKTPSLMNLSLTNSMSKRELEQLKADSYNKLSDPATDYDCPICKNRQLIAFVDDTDTMAVKPCSCISIRRTLKKIKKSGLQSLFDDYTFSKYNVFEKWQENIKNKAEEYIKDHSGKWFFIGGQTSCGKTHICTAIVGEFINQYKDATYMLWIDKSTELKANKNNYEVYEKLMSELKDVDVLYIDDFLKNEQNTPPTSADVRLAYEILNYRYNNPDLITIISSEYLIKDILKIDEAVGSRIFQRSKDYQINIPPDIKKNYRLR